MNKGFSYYFAKSWNLSFYSFNRAPFRIKLLLGLYCFVSMFGKLFFFLRPLFVLSENNMSNMIDDIHNISFEKMFQGVTKKKFIDLLFSYLLTDLLLAAVYVTCVLVPVLIMDFTHYSVPSIINTVVFGIITLISVYFLLINVVPLGYIAHKNSSLDFSDLTHNSKMTVKRSRGTIFLDYFIPTLINGSIFAIIGVSIWAVFAFGHNLGSTNEQIYLYASLIFIALFVVSILVWNLFITPVYMTMRTAIYLLMKDIALTKKPIVVKPVAGQSVGYEPLFDDEKEEFSKLDINSNQREGR